MLTGILLFFSTCQKMSKTYIKFIGLFMPTDGTAYICGFDIRYDMDEIHQIIGNKFSRQKI